MTWWKSKTLKALTTVCFVDASKSLQLPSNVNVSMPYTREHSEALTMDKVYSSITVDQVSGKDELKGGSSYESTTHWFLACTAEKLSLNLSIIPLASEHQSL